MERSTTRIALLIDADNAPASKIEVILDRLKYLGTVRVRRAYGNWKKDHLQGWAKILHKYAITPVQQFDYVAGKNATDIALTIDAMDLLQTMQPDIFGIVAGDSDYTPLVVRLMASGSQVFGFGRLNSTSLVFRESCTEFVSLGGNDSKLKGIGSAGPSLAAISVASHPALDKGEDIHGLLPAGTPQGNGNGSYALPEQIFIDAVTKHQNKTGWADVKSIGAYLSQRKIFKAQYNVNRWVSYFKGFPTQFEVREQDGKTTIRLIERT
ncbi:NYN domain-containing protein [Leptolyngbya sp. PCC 6406]|uniref:NYN domain-containing protein n=1 Tax=Leptolyngbya sp. PCC 6406 TaxID=1173264 RepID=UPI0002AC9E7F|nr:NYN domain-containing protein [Leptolyngbya sp. PCC 6406]